ncbi:unnamed protein product [Allacma fusca]|uniref:Uncharacterized protein n=1 Tax=Allacma fusca TaxID=39272 RepID=A0A8J2MCL5_9HEXA|nr:unnamed protein product [Allacma fusca]
MGKTTINYTPNKKLSPRVQRYQFRKHFLQVRTRLAGNISNHVRRSEQEKVSSQNDVVSIVEVPEGQTQELNIHK